MNVELLAKSARIVLTMEQYLHDLSDFKTVDEFANYYTQAVDHFLDHFEKMFKSASRDEEQYLELITAYVIGVCEMMDNLIFISSNITHQPIISDQFYIVFATIAAYNKLLQNDQKYLSFKKAIKGV